MHEKQLNHNVFFLRKTQWGSSLKRSDLWMVGTVIYCPVLCCKRFNAMIISRFTHLYLNKTLPTFVKVNCNGFKTISRFIFFFRVENQLTAVKMELFSNMATLCHTPKRTKKKKYQCVQHENNFFLFKIQNFLYTVLVQLFIFPLQNAIFFA